MNKILVVGSVNIDLVIKTERIPSLGETVSGSGFSTICGGKGANQAVAIAKSGGDVTMLACVGDDVYGKMAISNLNRAGVCPAVKVCDNAPTGVAVITVCGGDNHIILDAGANGLVTKEMIAANEALFQAADIVVLQLEIPMEAVETAARLAKKHGCTVVLNPAPFQHLSRELILNVDLFVPNEFEASQVVGFEISGKEQVKKAICALEEMGIKQPVITLGAQVSAFRYGGEVVFQPAFRVTAVDTTAAGDTFIGGICACLCRGLTLKESVRYASAASAIAVSRFGASVSVPSKEEVLTFLSLPNCE